MQQPVQGGSEKLIGPYKNGIRKRKLARILMPMMALTFKERYPPRHSTQQSTPRAEELPELRKRLPSTSFTPGWFVPSPDFTTSAIELTGNSLLQSIFVNTTGGGMLPASQRVDKKQVIAQIADSDGNHTYHIMDSAMWEDHGRNGLPTRQTVSTHPGRSALPRTRTP
ncbi:hypothetical protein B0T21DRAFT_345663 [Apiosordaria backusii]|uniref:Uncharacterized protein n=1 Tax=Apiosordaria backusii TaxID=314023 RepID=A0AA40K0T3_9PEZI|nr:hypothetical protein B0T21DRAFT_345663 [Apiosordaria backusii]